MLKPSRRVEGRWLAVLEDGSILRLGEGEVVDFALYAGKELSEGEAEALTAGGTPERTAPESPQPADLQSPMSRRELERKLAELGGRAGGGGRHLLTGMEELGYLNDAAYAAQVVRLVLRQRATGSGSCGTSSTAGGCPRELWEEALAQAADSGRGH